MSDVSIIRDEEDLPPATEDDWGVEVPDDAEAAPEDQA
jgi:hypothetical protein